MKNKFWSIFTAAVIACGAFTPSAQSYVGSYSAVASAASTLSTPKADKSTGTYYSSGSMTVKLSCANSGSTIYYSLNGNSYRKYTSSGVKITKNSTLKIYAKKDTNRSDSVTYTYKLIPKVTVSLASGTYDSAQTVTLSSAASGVKYYYTLDGTKPTKSSAKYTSAGIQLTESSTLRILAVKANWSTRYITKKYVIDTSSDDSSSSENLSILDDYESKYAYSTLTSAQKKCYARIFKAATNHTDADVADLGLNETDIEKAYWAFDYDNPQFFWLANGYGYTYSSTKSSTKMLTVKMMYSRTKDEAEKLQSKFDAAAQKLIDNAMKYDNDFDRIKSLHDDLVNMTQYTTTGPSYISEADGPLLNGKALCEGYSKAFMYLCQSIGIQCVCVSGGSHMWNMVKVNGDWYHVDVTWDDPVNIEMLRHDYFCVSTKTILTDHSLNTTLFTVPSATKNYSE
jgi:transglutaminase/protease-like cytokinesis protein 3